MRVPEAVLDEVYYGEACGSQFLGELPADRIEAALAFVRDAIEVFHANHFDDLVEEGLDAAVTISQLLNGTLLAREVRPPKLDTRRPIIRPPF